MLSPKELAHFKYRSEFDSLEIHELFERFCNEYTRITGRSGFKYFKDLSGYAHVNHVYDFARGEADLKITHLLQIQDATGIDWFSRWLAHQGGLLIIGKVDRDVPVESLLKTIRECSDVFDVTAEVWDNEIISQEEYDRLEPESLEAIEAILGNMLTAEAKMKGEQ